MQLSIHVCVGVGWGTYVRTTWMDIRFFSAVLSICKGSGSRQSLELMASHAMPRHVMHGGRTGSTQLLAAALTWRLNERDRERVCGRERG
jgi:hypothetical protein